MMHKQNKLYLFFCLDYKGHHMEYINYQYHHAINNGIKAIFLLNPNCEQHKKIYTWPKSDNVKIGYFSQKEIAEYELSSGIKKSFKACSLLKKYDKIFNPDIIISNNIITFYPAVIFASLKAKLHGILYQIPQHIQAKGVKKLLHHYVKPLMLRMGKCVGRIWLLNDKRTPLTYNSKLKTNKFCYLPDPISEQNALSCISPNSGHERVRFEHIGGMSDRKGTFTILDAIMLLSPEEQSKFVFSFSGRLSPRDEERFNEYRAKLVDKSTIEYNPGLIEQDRFNELIAQSDYILIPYKNVENSSGILGHAALHHKPVIGPAEGLLGQLIQDYKLGISINGLTPQSLKDSIMNILQFDTQICEFNKYVADNSVQNFNETIFQI